MERNKILTKPLNARTPLSIPSLKGNEWKYVKECLDTGWVSSVGAFVDRFEGEFAEMLGTGHTLSTVNGTAALHISLIVAGVQPDDEVLVSDMTFIAPVNSIRYAGAWPVLIDAEPDYWQMDVNRVIDFLENGCNWDGKALRNIETGRRIGAIVPVHILGHPVDMDPLLAVARKFSLPVIEDATESLGAMYKGRTVGTLGDISCFSFNGNKLITTGGGGMIATNDPVMARRARHLTTQAKTDPLEYAHDEVGYNYRLTNVLAAIGCAQLERLADHISAKLEIAGCYSEALSGIDGITVMAEAEWASSVFWMYTVLIDEAKTGFTSRDLMARFAELNIETRPLWQPMHLSEVHKESQASIGDVSEHLCQTALSLPCSVETTREQQARVISTITRDDG